MNSPSALRDFLLPLLPRWESDLPENIIIWIFTSKHEDFVLKCDVIFLAEIEDDHDHKAGLDKLTQFVRIMTNDEDDGRDHCDGVAEGDKNDGGGGGEDEEDGDGVGDGDEDGESPSSSE